MSDTETKQQNDLRNLRGVISNIDHRRTTTGKNVGQPYFYAKFRTVLSKVERDIVVMGFGAAYEACKDALVEGQSIRLNGFFQKGTGTGSTFKVVGLGAETKAEAAAREAAEAMPLAA